MRRPAAAEPMPAWAQWRFAPSDDRMTVPDTPSKTPAIGLGSAARELYRALWRHAEGVRAQLLGAAALLSAAQLMRLFMPWLAAQAINALQRGDLAAAGR